MVMAKTQSNQSSMDSTLALSKKYSTAITIIINNKMIKGTFVRFILYTATSLIYPACFWNAPHTASMMSARASEFSHSEGMLPYP